MNFIMSLMFAFLAVSCDQLSHNTDSNKNMSIIEKQSSQIGLDSVAVSYLRNADANEYILKYSNGEMQITCNYSSFEKLISDKDIIDKFISYIDDFFITKSEKIEYSRLKSLDPIVADYSMLKFDIFLENKPVVKESIQIGEEEYDIEYNPKFLEFYEFLDSLVKVN